MSSSIRTRSKAHPILLGCFLALVIITAWEAASSYAAYSVTMETDSESGTVHEVVIRDGNRRLEIEVRGEIEMTPDESAIERLGADAYLEIEEKRGRARRSFQATPGPGGTPEVVWLVDRKPAAFDDEGKKWLARVMRHLYRATGHNAEARVERLLADGGVSAVLSEISKISGDTIARTYFEQLISQTELSANDLARALRQMAREIGSDHELGLLMQALPATAPSDDVTADAWLAAAGSISSDYELRQMLSAFFARADLEPGSHETLLDASEGIGNDYELATLLVEVAEIVPPAQVLPAGYVRALRTIGSDFEHCKVLNAALKRPGIDGRQLGNLLETATEIGADFELAELLADVAPNDRGELPDAYFRALATIGSDFEQRKVLGSLAERPVLSVETLESLLDAALDISSDHELATFLRQLADAHGIAPEIRPMFDRALATIGSDHERERVLAEIDV